MLSRIIERASTQCEAGPLQLERVNLSSSAPTSSSAGNPKPPDIAVLNQRIAQLERSLVENESAAYARGRREAEAEARQRLDAGMQNTAERLAQSVHQLADLRPHLCKEAESDLLRLAIAIARRILHRELNVDETALQGLVKVSLDRLGRQDQVRVRVHPSLAGPISAILTKLSSRPPEVFPDSALESGGLIFETSRGQLDASIQSQLDEIERGLIDHLENR